MSQTNAVNANMQKGSFSPNLVIGPDSTGISTSVLYGHWQLLGNLLYINIGIVLLSKGANVGDVGITNMPFSTGASPPTYTMFMHCNNVILDTGYAYFLVQPVPSQTSLILAEGGTNNALNALTNANLNDDSELFFTGQYIVSV